MPHPEAWLKNWGSYSPTGRWSQLNPPRKMDEGKGKPKVDLPTSWTDEAKDLTNTILAGNPDIKKSVQWNQDAVYMDMASLVRILEKILEQGIKPPVFYNEVVLPHMLQNGLSSSPEVVASNETPAILAYQDKVLQKQDKVLQAQEGSVTSHKQVLEEGVVTNPLQGTNSSLLASGSNHQTSPDVSCAQNDEVEALGTESSCLLDLD